MVIQKKLQPVICIFKPPPSWADLVHYDDYTEALNKIEAMRSRYPHEEYRLVDIIW